MDTNRNILPKLRDNLTTGVSQTVWPFLEVMTGWVLESFRLCLTQNLTPDNFQEVYSELTTISGEHISVLSHFFIHSSAVSVTRLPTITLNFHI